MRLGDGERFGEMRGKGEGGSIGGLGFSDRRVFQVVQVSGVRVVVGFEGSEWERKENFFERYGFQGVRV